MQIFLALSIVLCTWLSGCAIAYLFGRKSHLEMAGLGFILGSLYITLAILLIHQYSHLAISARLVLSVAYLSGLTAVTVLKPSYNASRLLFLSATSWYYKSSLLTKTLLIILVILGINSLLQNYFWPVSDWDALALYDFRGKVVASTGSFISGIELGYFFQYPPFTSLLHSMLYVVGFDRVKIWYSLLYFSLLIVFYAQLRKHTTTPISLAGTVSLASNPLILEHATIAYTNLSYTIFLSLGILYLVDWFRTQSVSTILLGSTLVLGSSWVRLTEPFWLVPLLILAFILIVNLRQQRTRKYALAAAVGIMLIYWGKGIWQNFLNELFAQNLTVVAEQTAAPTAVTTTPPVQNTLSWLSAVPVIGAFAPYITALTSKDVPFILQRASEIASYMYAYILPTVAAYLVPALVLAYFDISKKTIHSIALLCVLILYLMLLFMGTLLFSLLDGSWSEIGGSANRMSMFLIPLFIFAIFSSQRLHLWIKKTQE